MSSVPSTHEAVLLLGPTGGMASTLARWLERALGYRRVDMDRLLVRRAELDDAIGRRIAIARARGICGPKREVLATLVDHLARLPLDLPVVIEGFPRTSLDVAAIDDGRVPLDVAAAIWVDGDGDGAGPPAGARGRRTRAARPSEVPQAARIRAARDALESVRTHYARRGVLHVVDGRADPDAVGRALLAVLEPDAIAR